MSFVIITNLRRIAVRANEKEMTDRDHALARHYPDYSLVIRSTVLQKKIEFRSIQYCEINHSYGILLQWVYT